VTFAHRASKESLASVARRRAVVLAGRSVVADGARGGRRSPGWTQRCRGYAEVSPRPAADCSGWIVEDDACVVVARLEYTAAGAAHTTRCQVHVTEVCSFCIIHHERTRTELVIDHIFYLTRPNPTHRLIDPARPSP